VNVTFNYDRYIMNYKGNNSKPSPNEAPDENIVDRLSRNTLEEIEKYSGVLETEDMVEKLYRNNRIISEDQ